MVCLRLLITLLIMVHRKYVYIWGCALLERGKEILGLVLVTVFDVKLCQYDLSVLQRYLKLLTVFIAVLAINMLCLISAAAASY